MASSQLSSAHAEPMRGSLAASLAVTVRALRRDALGAVGLALLAAICILALAGPLVVSANPLDTTADTLVGPSWAHLFGTDEFGRDIFSRVIHALRLDLFIALVAVSGAVIVGTTVGAFAGYAGGRVDDVSMRIVDIVMSFPMFILGLGLVAFLGAGMKNLIIVTTVINIPIFARLIRAEILSRKDLEYVAAARCSGSSDVRILVRHLLPNAAGPLIVQATLSLGWTLLNAAGLSFLGVGIRPPTPELGVMVAEGAEYMSQGVWWISVLPGLFIAVFVFAVNLVGDGLQERLDPRQRAM